MFLFLDVVSPIPEFHLIKDKKIIVSIKITENNDEKLSDTIIPKYLKSEWEIFDYFKKKMKNIFQIKIILKITLRPYRKK